MDSNYIITRLKSTPYKYPTVQLLRTRLQNLDDKQRDVLVSHLKIELNKHRNVDIHEPLSELLYRTPLAS